MIRHVGFIDNEPEVSDGDKADMEKELVTLLQADELAAMGITLFDSKDGEALKTKKLKDSLEKPSMLVMFITDGDKFTDTLYKLKPIPEQQEQTAATVASLLSNTVGLIQAAYGLKKPDELEQANNFEAIKSIVDSQLNLFMELSPALVEQGFGTGEAYEELTEYAARHSSGTLEDYREAEARGFIGDGFGPASWPKDAGPGYLDHEWTEVFEYLKGLRDRESPSPLFTELFNKLRKDFDSSRGWLKSYEAYDDTDYQTALREHEKEHAKAHQELETRLIRQGKDPRFVAFAALDTHLELPEKPEYEGYPKSYIEPLKKEMTEISTRWEMLFPLENSFYLSELAQK